MSKNKEILSQALAQIQSNPNEQINYTKAFNAYYSLAQESESHDEKIAFLKSAIDLITTKLPYITRISSTIDLEKLYEGYDIVHSRLTPIKHSQIFKPQKIYDLERYVEVSATNWYKNKETLDVAVDLSKTILDIHKSDVICSLGHSPSWIVKMAEIMSTVTSQEHIFKYIPFSGRFCMALEQNHKADTKTFFEKPLITEILHL